ncbi:hypothetical protein B0H13DRAFT_1900727 [Mycena leptocephala]|nr:hypothetical protein B0H13DRAFT_1900727 [Mycena leptocephala]
MSPTPTLLCRLLDAGGQGRSVGQRNGLAKNYLFERDPRSCIDFELWLGDLFKRLSQVVYSAPSAQPREKKTPLIAEFGSWDSNLHRRNHKPNAKGQQKKRRKKKENARRSSLSGRWKSNPGLPLQTVKNVSPLYGGVTNAPRPIYSLGLRIGLPRRTKKGTADYSDPGSRTQGSWHERLGQLIASGGVPYITSDVFCEPTGGTPSIVDAAALAVATSDRWPEWLYTVNGTQKALTTLREKGETDTTHHWLKSDIESRIVPAYRECLVGGYLQGGGPRAG